MRVYPLPGTCGFYTLTFIKLDKPRVALFFWKRKAPPPWGGGEAK
jgi:hypothetical protein